MCWLCLGLLPLTCCFALRSPHYACPEVIRVSSHRGPCGGRAPHPAIAGLETTRLPSLRPTPPLDTPTLHTANIWHCPPPTGREV